MNEVKIVKGPINDIDLGIKKILSQRKAQWLKISFGKFVSFRGNYLLWNVFKINDLNRVWS